LALPKLWRGDDHPTKIHSYGTGVMRSLRFFVRLQPIKMACASYSKAYLTYSLA
jgi:hypothetical protein